MSPWEPATWAWWIWILHGVGVLYLILFVWEYFRLERLERHAMDGGPEDLARFNAAILGFPHSGFAKMLGKRRLEDD